MLRNNWCVKFRLFWKNLKLTTLHRFFSEDRVIELNEWMYVNEILDSLSQHFEDKS